MIGRLGLSISRVFRKLIPDPLVIAILLTLVTIVAALAWGRFEPGSDRWLTILDSWQDSKTGIQLAMPFKATDTG